MFTVFVVFAPSVVIDTAAVGFCCPTVRLLVRICGHIHVVPRSVGNVAISEMLSAPSLLVHEGSLL
jgi:hypothetical protein